MCHQLRSPRAALTPAAAAASKAAPLPLRHQHPPCQPAAVAPCVARRAAPATERDVRAECPLPGSRRPAPARRRRAPLAARAGASWIPRAGQHTPYRSRRRSFSRSSAGCTAASRCIVSESRRRPRCGIGRWSARRRFSHSRFRSANTPIDSAYRQLRRLRDPGVPAALRPRPSLHTHARHAIHVHVKAVHKTPWPTLGRE